MPGAEPGADSGKRHPGESGRARKIGNDSAEAVRIADGLRSGADAGVLFVESGRGSAGVADEISENLPLLLKRTKARHGEREIRKNQTARERGHDRSY